MNIWLIKIGEPLPTDDDGKDRLHRIGILASMLVDEGHKVVWWSSTFDHVRKTHRYTSGITVQVNPSYQMQLLHGVAYKKNISVSRIMNHRQVAANFARSSKVESPPDIILSCWPTLELCEAAINYAKPRGIPVLIDVRDLWPDLFLEVVPRPLRSLASSVLAGSILATKRVYKQATGILGVSQKYLDWGLTHAGRAQSQFDAVFPLGYPSISLTADEIDREKRELRELGVDDSKMICCFIGTFGRSYDLAPVIEVAQRMKSEGIEGIQFVFCGDGEKRAMWTSQARELDNVIFTGWVPFQKLAVLMQMVDVGLAAYTATASQGLPNKVFEYLSAGLPIVSSLKGETEAFIARYNCGISYDANDTNSLFEALCTLFYHKEERERLGLQGLRCFQQNYSSQKVYAEMIAHIENVATTKAHVSRQEDQEVI